MRRIDRLLSDLIWAQNSVTHMNAQGREGEMATRILMDQRNAISAEILAYVERLERMVQDARVALL